MFSRYRWLELLYSISGNFVLSLNLVVLFLHVSQLSGAQWKLLWQGNSMVVTIFTCTTVGMLVVLAFSSVCSLALATNLAGMYDASERLYKLTLAVRQMVPVAGRTARVDYWQLSLANCYRLSGKYEQAEKIYRELLETKKSSPLDRLTHFGFREVVRENLVALLSMNGRQGESQEIRSSIVMWKLVVLRVKYLLLSALVLLGGCWFAPWADMRLHLMEADCYFRAGAFRECIDACTRALDREPDCSAAYKLRGTARKELGQVGLSELDFLKLKSSERAH